MCSRSLGGRRRPFSGTFQCSKEKNDQAIMLSQACWMCSRSSGKRGGHFFGIFQCHKESRQKSKAAANETS